MKAANKGARAPAELPEGRASTKGNSQDQSTYRTQGRGSVSQAVERIRQAATRKPQEKLTALLHLRDPAPFRLISRWNQSSLQAHFSLDKAAG